MKVSPSMISKNSKTHVQSKRKLWLMRLSEKSRNVREQLLQRRQLRRKSKTKIRLSNKRLRIRPPKKPQRKLEAKERNDDPSYLNPYII